jgi:hypothetical protein
MKNTVSLLVGILGISGAGKDTTADLLVQDHGFVKVSLADPVKQIARRVYAFSDEQLWGPGQAKVAPDKRYPRPDGSFLTPREALQSLGTEWGRGCYPNTWVELGIRTAHELLLDGGVSLQYSHQLGIHKRQDGLRGRTRSVIGVVIPDVRFKNEVAAIKESGGLLVKISRPGAGLPGALGLHSSETEQASIPDSAFDKVLQNTGTIEDLRLMVDAFMRQISGCPRPLPWAQA